MSHTSRMLLRIRDNDPTLKCLRVSPAIPISHYSRVLLRNTTICQVIVCAADSRADSRATDGSPCMDLVSFGLLLESLVHLPLAALDVSDLSLTSEHLQHIVWFLRSAKYLKRLNLSKNAISVAMAAQIGEAIAQKNVLESLNVAQCELGDKGMVSLLESLIASATSSLSHLNVAYNVVGDEGGLSLKKWCSASSAKSSSSSSSSVADGSPSRTIVIHGNFIPAALSESLAVYCHRTVSGIESAPHGAGKKKGATGSSQHQDGASKGRRPSSALGFLETVDPANAPYPSLGLLSKQLDTDS